MSSAVLLESAALVANTYSEDLKTGLLINSMIKSSGSAESPSPPKKTKKIHPMNESRAII